MIELVELGAEDPRLARFHAGIYLDAFAAQHEPLAVWQRALRGELPYELHVRLAVDRDAIAAGIAYERYPRSACGLVTYLVVAPAARRAGLGERMFREAAAALYADGARIVLGEVVDPAKGGDPGRLARFQRWGARVLDVPYIQPALAPGLARDASLLLIALPPVPDPVPRDVIEVFLDELYTVCEGHTRQAAFTVSPAKSPR